MLNNLLAVVAGGDKKSILLGIVYAIREAIYKVCSL
jgi:hypothetical protein